MSLPKVSWWWRRSSLSFPTSRFSVAVTIRRNRRSRHTQTNGWRINVEHLHIWHDLSVNELDSKTGVPWGLTCAMCTLPNSFHFVPMFQSPLRTCGPVNGFQAAGAVNDSFQMLDYVGFAFGDVLQSSMPFRATPWAQLGIWVCCTFVASWKTAEYNVQANL